ncbi:MAG TPA: hypothetical protein VGE15_05455 [Sphingobacteriaceae bacterium]
MKIFQPRFLIFFFVVLVVPPVISYLGGWDRTLDYLFFLKAFAISFFLTVAYYLLVKRQEEKRR